MRSFFNIRAIQLKNTTIKIINFMKTVEKLGLVKRDNLMSDGRPENDSDHILKLCYLVMMVHPYLKKETDYIKMLEMALVHDLVEAKTGDFSLSEQAHNPQLREMKKKKEMEAIEYYKAILPSPINEKIYNIFIEYEQRKTTEAQIVWILDKLEANLQANQYNGGDIRYWKDCPNGEMYYEYGITKKPLISELNEEILLEMEDMVITITKHNIEKMKSIS